MNEPIFLSGYVLLLAGVLVGIAKCKYLNRAMGIVLAMLTISVFTELIAYIAVLKEKIIIKDVTYHVYSIIEIVLITFFFLEVIKPCHHRKLRIVTVFLWPTLGILNVVFLQPLQRLNTNILMLESFSIITMSLYLIYWLLKKNSNENIVRNVHFQVAILWLVYWSGTFFFWAFIKVLYSDRWPYIQTAITIQSIVLLMTYCGFFLVFLLHPKKVDSIESY